MKPGVGSRLFLTGLSLFGPTGCVRSTVLAKDGRIGEVHDWAAMTATVQKLRSARLMGLKRGRWNFRMFAQHILEWVNRMQEILTLLALAGIAALLSGCAALAAAPIASVVGSVGGSAVEIHQQTEVRLQEANFIMTKLNVVGESGGFSLLGILPIVSPKYSKALDRLYKQAEMQSGRSQTLANLIIEKNSTYLVLFSLPRISIRADIIEFMPATVTNTSPRPPPPKEPNSQSAEQ